MSLAGTGKSVRIYIGEADHWHGKPLYRAIVELLRSEGISGATVLRGVEGFGAHSTIHTAHVLRLSEDLPVVIDVVDTAEKIERILPRLTEMVVEGMITLTDVQVVFYGGHQRS